MGEYQPPWIDLKGNSGHREVCHLTERVRQGRDRVANLTQSLQEHFLGEMTFFRVALMDDPNYSEEKHGHFLISENELEQLRRAEPYLQRAHAEFCELSSFHNASLSWIMAPIRRQYVRDELIRHTTRLMVAVGRSGLSMETIFEGDLIGPLQMISEIADRIELTDDELEVLKFQP